VILPDGRILAQGREPFADTHPDDLGRLDFRGKSVLDLGCNFGFYSFLLRRLGAGRVVGVDSDPRAVAGCRCLKEIWGYEDMEFHCADFTNQPLSGPFDVVLFLNYLGKRSLCKGMTALIAQVRDLARQWVVLSARPAYRLPGRVPCSAARLRDLYGPEVVRDDRLDVACLVRRVFGPRWRWTRISAPCVDPTIKVTWLLEAG